MDDVAKAARDDAPRPWWPPRPFVQALASMVVFGVGAVSVAIIGETLVARHAPSLVRRGLPLVIVTGAVLSYVVAARVIELRWPRELGWRRLPELVGGLVLGAGACLALMAVMRVAGWMVFEGRRADADVITGIVVVGVSVGVSEELFFRGMIYRHIEHLLGTWIALGVTTVVFAALHLAQPNASAWGTICLAIEGGIFFGLLFTLTRSLWLVMGMHTAWNAVQGPVLGSRISGGHDGSGWLISSPGGSPVWSGGEFGMEGSALTLMVFLLLSVGMWALMRYVPRYQHRWVPWLGTHIPAPPSQHRSVTR